MTLTNLDSRKVLIIDGYNMIHRCRFQWGGGKAIGEFQIVYNFFRTLVGSPDDSINDLFIDEISSSRKEIRLKISGDASQIEQEIFEDFGDKLSIKKDSSHSASK